MLSFVIWFRGEYFVPRGSPVKTGQSARAPAGAACPAPAEGLNQRAAAARAANGHACRTKHELMTVLLESQGRNTRKPAARFDLWGEARLRCNGFRGVGCVKVLSRRRDRVNDFHAPRSLGLRSWCPSSRRAHEQHLA